jgi:hypothetical protein
MAVDAALIAARNVISIGLHWRNVIVRQRRVEFVA